MKDVSKLMILSHVDETDPLSGRTTVVAPIDSEFQIGSQSNFSGDDVTTGSGAMDKINNAVTEWNSYKGDPALIVKNIRQTAMQWSGNGRPSFNLAFTLVQYSPDSEDITKLVRKLLYLTSPKLNKDTEWAYTAPGGYSFNRLSADSYKNGLKGVWTLHIGKWLSIPNLVISSFSVSASKQVMQHNNKPVRYRVSCTATPALMVDAGTILDWFKD